MFHALHRRNLLRALFLALAATAPAWAQSSAADLDYLWRHGLWDKAREIIAAGQNAGNKTAEFLSAAATAAEEMQDWPAAAELYAQSAKLALAKPDVYREARGREWRCRAKAAGFDRNAGWVAAAQQEVDTRLGAIKGKKSADYQIALELQYLLAKAFNEYTLPGAELCKRFPDSDLVLLAAKNQADEIANARDEKARLELIDSFLQNYPGCYWRHIAYRYKLYSAWRLRDHALLRSAAHAYLTEYPNHPDSHGTVSRYYFEADLYHDEGLAAAKRSVELYETALGTDGSPSGVSTLQRDTAGAPLQPDYLPPDKRARFLDYLGSRFNLARYQLADGQWKEVLELVEPVLAAKPFSADEDLTLAPFYLLAGQANLALKDYSTAYRDFLGALVEGDATNRYAVQADALLAKAADKLSAGERDQIRAEFTPASISGSTLTLPRFSDSTAAAGLDGATGNCVSWADVNNDGNPDLLTGGSELWLNQGGRGFTDATRQWGLTAGGTGGTFADCDNDGDLDLYVFGAGRHADKLWRNEGGRFVDVTTAAGDPSDDETSSSAAWLDYDADGSLDLFVANMAQPNSAARNKLYRGNGHGMFALLSPADCGMQAPFGPADAADGISVADYEGDGDSDIFVGNTGRQENLLWSYGGGGRFADLARLVGVAGYSVDGHYGNTLGSDWGDFDNDGDLDLFCANQALARHLYDSNKSMLLVARTTGDPEAALKVLYADQRAGLGIKYEETHCDPLWGDFNNDGWLDLYITSRYENRRSFLYLNDGGKRFVDVTYLAGARVLGGYGCAAADFDRDGDLDIAVGSDSRITLLRNDSPPQGWLEVRCVGAAGSAGAEPGSSNRSAIGARVTVSLGPVQFTREVQSSKGVGCENDLVAHFGLGAPRGRIGVIVRFPSGKVVTRALLAGDTLVEIPELTSLENAGQPKPAPQPSKPKPAAVPSDAKGGMQRPPDARR